MVFPTFDFVVNDAKVRIVETDISGNILQYTLGRENNVATLTVEGGNEELKFLEDGSVLLLRIRDSSQVTSITDNRDGTTITVTPPATLTEFFEDIIEESNNPFFFSDIATEDTLSELLSVVTGSYVEHDEKEITYLFPLTKGQVDYIAYKLLGVEVKRETLSYDAKGNISGIIIT